MKRTVGLTTVALFAGTALVAAGPVAASPGSCASQHICVYDGANYVQPQYSATAAAYALGSMNDKAESLGNSRASNRARYYEKDNYGGWNVCVSAGDAHPTLASDRRNRISSMAIQTSQYC